MHNIIIVILIEILDAWPNNTHKHNLFQVEIDSQKLLPLIEYDLSLDLVPVSIYKVNDFGPYIRYISMQYFRLIYLNTYTWTIFMILPFRYYYLFCLPFIYYLSVELTRWCISGFILCRNMRFNNKNCIDWWCGKCWLI